MAGRLIVVASGSVKVASVRALDGGLGVVMRLVAVAVTLFDLVASLDRV
jgi:hypothetical protein